MESPIITIEDTENKDVKVDDSLLITSLNEARKNIFDTLFKNPSLVNLRPSKRRFGFIHHAGFIIISKELI